MVVFAHKKLNHTNFYFFVDKEKVIVYSECMNKCSYEGRWV